MHGAGGISGDLRRRLDAIAVPAYVRDSRLALVAANAGFTALTGDSDVQNGVFRLPEGADLGDVAEKERRALVFGDRQRALVFDDSGRARYEIALERLMTDDACALVIGEVTVLAAPVAACDTAADLSLAARLRDPLGELLARAGRLADAVPEGGLKDLALSLRASAQAVFAQLDQPAQPEAADDSVATKRLVVVMKAGASRQRILALLDANGTDAVAADSFEDAVAMLEEAARLELKVDAVLLADAPGADGAVLPEAFAGVELLRLPVAKPQAAHSSPPGIVLKPLAPPQMRAVHAPLAGQRHALALPRRR